MTVSWEAIDRVTHGRLGRTMATCPLCSENRHTPQKRRNEVLAVTLLEPEFAVFYCYHCGTNGYCRPDTPRLVINIAEQKRRRQQADRHTAFENAKRTQRALAIWNDAEPFHGSPAEDYLRDNRGIGDWLDTFADLDEVFRFHPTCLFGLDQYLPCLVALVCDIKSNAGIGIHRTALTSDDPPQKIDRMSKGLIGGGAIKISPDHEATRGLLIGEGIETVLSASKRFQFKPCWSLVSAGGVSNFPVLPGIESVTIAVDNDPKGEGEQAAEECAERLLAGGIEVITAQTEVVKDFNDLIRPRSHG
jgi:hypothetical protein